MKRLYIFLNFLTFVENRRALPLNELLDFYTEHFDYRKLWGYGCHCLMLGNF